MNLEPDLIIRNSRLRGEDKALVDIAVVGNKISNIEPKIKSKAKLEIDASKYSLRVFCQSTFTSL